MCSAVVQVRGKLSEMIALHRHSIIIVGDLITRVRAY